MNTTFKPILNSRPKADGTYTIMIRMTTAKKHKYVAVGHSVPKQHWNPRAKNGLWVRATNKLHAVINGAIDKKLIKLKVLASDLALPNSVNIKKAAEGYVSSSFIVFAERNLEMLLAAKKIATYKKRKSVITELKEYLKDKDLLFKDINIEFLEDYNKHLHTKTSNKVNTINTKFRTIRAVLYDAIRKGHMKQSDNPFFGFTLIKEKSKKRGLTKHELQRIEDLKLEEGSLLWHVRNYFIFSYLNFGMRFGDFVTLRWTNIQTEEGECRLTYQMNKTGDSLSIRTGSKAKKILNYYRTHNVEGSPFIFPLLTKDFDDLSDMEQFNLISSKNAYVNKVLKDLASLAKCDLKLSFHMARHTFATHARDKTQNLSMLQKALRHSSLLITQTYLESLTDKDLDDFNKNMYDE